MKEEQAFCLFLFHLRKTVPTPKQTKTVYGFRLPAYHLFSTFSAKPGKSLTSIARPSSSTARPVKMPKT